MEQLVLFLQNHFPYLVEHKYVFLLVASSIEGLNTMILAGFLVSIGGLALIPAALVCLAGELINSYFWYTVGYVTGGKSIEWYTRNNPKRKKTIEKIRSYLGRHTGKILLISKVTFSLTIATLVLTGSMRYSLKKFSGYNLVGSIGWIIVTFSLGFFFGQGYKYYLDYFQSLSYLILFGAVGVFFVYTAEHISNAIFIRTIFINDRIQELNEKIKEGITRLMDDSESKR